MVSGRTQDGHGEQVTIRRLPPNKSQSSISIPTAYHPLADGVYQPLTGSSSINPASLTEGEYRNFHVQQQPGRSSRPIGPGYYQRTLSSSSLLTNKSSVSKSRSDYSAIGGGGRSNFSGFISPSKFTEYENYSKEIPSDAFRRQAISSSSSNIVYIDNTLPPEDHCYAGDREYRQRRLIRESSQPIIIHVPITAPKATATTLSRATSPPPPQYLSSISSPKKSHQDESNSSSSSRRQQRGDFGPSKRRIIGFQKKNTGQGGAVGNSEIESESETSEDTETDREEELSPKFKRHETPGIKLGDNRTEIKVDKKTPPNLVKYCRNAPLKKVKHPLEENIFSSLVITLVAVGLALVIGIPVLFATGALLLVAICVRYSIFVLYGCYSYLRFICSNRHLSRTTPPQIFPRDRLAFGNDVRWLGKRKPRQCQCVLQTLLVFDGTMDLGSLRHLVQTRVVHAETPEGELAYPRLMQKVIGFPAGYKWELDVTFDIQNHIFAGPSHIRNESQIQEYLGLLLTESLSLGKPLWEIRVISNYGAQKDTLAILRVHQCLADGMTLVRILSHSLADQAQMHIPQRPHFAGLSFGFNVIRSMIVGPLTFLMWLLTTFRDQNLFSVPLKRSRRTIFNLFGILTRVRQSSSGNGNGTTVRRLDEEHGTPLNDTVAPAGDDNTSPQIHHNKYKKKQKKPAVKVKKGKHKKGKKFCPWNVVWSAPVSVPKVARVKQIMRSSLNDVLLSAAAGSVRSYLQKQGIPCPDDVKVVIPIDLRNDITSPKCSTKLGCKVASVLATIPSGMEGSIPRLWATRHRLDELKASADPVVAYGAVTVLMNILPHPLAVALLDNITNKASLQFSNLPGPTHTLLVGGFPLKGIYPIYPPGGKIRVSISVFSYADQVHLTVVSHRSLPNAGPSLLQGITSQVEQLSKQLSQRRVPGESRRSARNASLNNPEITKPPTRQIHMQLQVVQEELQQLSHRLDGPQQMTLATTVEEENLRSSEESLGGGVASSSMSPAGQAQLRTRLKTLKSEFSELIGELRRRSSIVEGVQMSFEDEDSEEDFRKPRKRALSVVSMSRRNSLFASRSMTTPDSSVCYSSDDELPSSPSQDVRTYNPQTNIRLSSSPIRTTAV